MYCLLMSKQAAVVKLLPEQEASLKNWARAQSIEHRLRQRSQIILRAAAGETNQRIAASLGVLPMTVGKWRRRFLEGGLLALHDAPRSGMPARYDALSEQRILAALDKKPTAGFASWNGKLLAAHLGSVSKQQVWRVMRRHGINLARRRSWCVSTDPEFARKAADVVALYLNPPENAVVLAIDEKPAIQALERAQGWIKLPNGRALSGFSHEYKRHGTSTLFAALNVASGQVQAGHYTRRRRREFLAFMNEMVVLHPGRELHVVLDNLSSHKPKTDHWLRRHPGVHFHFTPTHASWLNQVEIWFSMLVRASLRGASFRSVAELRRAIDAFIVAHNKTAAPFEWTKAEVKPSTLKHKFTDLRN